jgi:class 3 adenylate cyclase
MTPAHHVLVVDDDWMNREVIETHLQIKNYRVSAVPNGQAALALIEHDPPDLIMLDVMLPDMSGYEVCTRLKAHEKTRFTPVVMVTALESDEDRLKAIEAGADDFLTKPFNSLLMLTRVKSLLRIKSLTDEVNARTELLQRILNRYVDQDIAQIILIDPDRYLKLGGETRRVTIAFADISGFTAFAEQYTAQEVVLVLNKFFSALTQLIFEHHGTFDKYIGDEIMAFFGAPVATGDDTLNAVKMAWAMQATFTRIKAELGAQALPLGLSIGIHTGDAVVGNVGSEQRMNYTVMGDAVNIAHRLQEASQSGQILLSQATYQEISPMVQVGPALPRMLSGKREAITTYELQGLLS